MLKIRQQFRREREQVGAKQPVFRLINHLELNLGGQNNQLLRRCQHLAGALHNDLTAAVYPADRGREQRDAVQFA